MFSFIFGAAVGAVGYWAYQQGMLPIGSGGSSHSDSSSMDMGSSMSGSMSGGSSPIVRPTAHEVSERPAEPIPGA